MNEVQWVVVVVEPAHEMPEGSYHGPFGSWDEACTFAEQFPDGRAFCFPLTPASVTPQQVRDEAAWKGALN
jgi:hypothetical protein